MHRVITTQLTLNWVSCLLFTEQKKPIHRGGLLKRYSFKVLMQRYQGFKLSNEIIVLHRLLDAKRNLGNMGFE
jgi:hypothetical protein